jgi:hypothetical protein
LRLLRNVPAETLATGAIVAAGFGFCVAVNWPGHLSYDSIVQLAEGRRAQYGGWHPPVMSWLLGLGDDLQPGTGLFIIFDTLLLYLATASLLFLRHRRSWATFVVSLGMVLTPQFLLYPGIVWKDVLFAASAVSGFVCLAFAAARWNKPVARIALISVALVLLVLASLARQNGGVTLPIAAFVVGWTVYRLGKRKRILDASLCGAGWLGAALLVWVCAGLALETRTVGTSGPVGQLRLLKTYDLAGALAAEPRLDLYRLAEDDPRLETQMRTNAARLYSPQRNDTLVQSSELQQSLIRADERTIPAQWREFVEGHPLLYLKVRWAAFRWVFLTPDLSACRPAFVGVSGPPGLMRELGVAPRIDGRDMWLANYVLAFAGTPLLSHAAFAVLAIVALTALLRRRRPEDIALIGMLLSGLAFTATFFVISIACDYRYLYFLDVAALVGLFYLSLDTREWLARVGSDVALIAAPFRRSNRSRT